MKILYFYLELDQGKGKGTKEKMSLQVIKTPSQWSLQTLPQASCICTALTQVPHSRVAQATLQYALKTCRPDLVDDVPAHAGGLELDDL